MRLPWTLGLLLVSIGCSSSSGSSAAGDTGSDASSGDGDAQTCQPLSAWIGVSGQDCPTTYGSVDCVLMGGSAHPLTCPTLDGYRSGFGIDTSTRCFYDRASHALVGVLRTMNVTDTCYGVVDPTCSVSPANLCSGGSSDASLVDGDGDGD